MIRSSKVSLKFCNKGKFDSIGILLDEYKRVTSLFVDLLWQMEVVPTLLTKELTGQIKSLTWLSSRLIQCSGKQASGIVRGTRKKQEQRLYFINKLNEEGKFKQARKLQKIYDDVSCSKPNIKKVEIELDERFVKIDLNNETSFDGWITLGSLGNKLKLVIPFKSSKHLNKLKELGQIKKGIRLSKSKITFNVEIEEPVNTGTETLGIDIGVKTLLSTSTGFQTRENEHGYNLDNINDLLAKKVKGSKGFKRTQSHRSNYISWSINQLNFKNVKVLKLEDIKNLRYKCNTSRKLNHFVYSEIFGKLEQRAEILGVQVVKVTPTYTSQRCSHCGWVRKLNRKGQKFKCTKCGYTQDADLNAAFNIQLDLSPIKKKERLLHKNRKGFYWSVVGQESIVSDTQKK